MRRRRPINVWPAFADLMTVLAVVGLVTTVGFLAAQQSEGTTPTLEELEAEQAKRQKAELLAVKLASELEKLRHKLAQTREVHKDAQETWANERASLEQEVINNERMFQATQRAQTIIDRIQQDNLLRFDADQSLRLGDELVRFERNKIKPIWQGEGKAHLRHFCKRLSEEFSRLESELEDPTSLFTVLVEGHTDSTQCPGDDLDCNWSFSSQRAVNFLALMREDGVCPGSTRWQILPVGYADTRPVSPAPEKPSEPIRRISLRVVPDYEKWTSIDD